MPETPQPTPAPDAGNRDTAGKFGPGNTAAKGNPINRRVHELRTALINAVGPDDVKDILAAMIKAAKMGDVAAAREVLDRVFGKSREAIDLTADITQTTSEAGIDWSKLSADDKVKIYELALKARASQAPTPEAG